jgi:uncharacterized protein YjiS (DUF1127 family)
MNLYRITSFSDILRPIVALHNERQRDQQWRSNMALMIERVGAKFNGESGFFDMVWHRIADTVSYVRRYHKYCSAELQLRELSNHVLNDIGISRHELGKRVWCDFSRR